MCGELCLYLVFREDRFDLRNRKFCQGRGQNLNIGGVQNPPYQQLLRRMVRVIFELKYIKSTNVPFPTSLEPYSFKLITFTVPTLLFC